MKFYPYSDNRQHRIVARGDNVSDVIDRMIRVTAKVTEHYASDIVYTINDLLAAIDNKTDLAVVLNFRECGVTTYSKAQLESPEVLRSMLSGGIQQWLLTVGWDGDIPETSFLRINISSSK